MYVLLTADHICNRFYLMIRSYFYQYRVSTMVIVVFKILNYT